MILSGSMLNNLNPQTAGETCTSFHWHLWHLDLIICFASESVFLDVCTGKSLSEEFILSSTNPQYDNRLFIDLPVQYMKTTSSEHGENMLYTQIGFCFCFDIISMF